MKKNYFSVFAMIVLNILAMAFGGAVAMAAPGVEVGDNGSDADPNDETPLEDATADAPGEGIDQQGHAATGSSVEEAELDDSQIDDYVMRYNAWKYPLHTDILNLAQKRIVKTKKPKHPVIGEAILECFTKGATNNADKAEQVELNLYGNDMKIFQTRGTIRVFGLTGYDEKGDPTGAPLMLYVVENSRNTKVTVSAPNGPIDEETGVRYVPTIPANTKLRSMAPACEEDVYDVAPDNFLPGWRQAYVQRKVCNITKTEFYDKMKKKVQGAGQLLKDISLDTFRRKCTSTALVGAPSHFTVWNEDLKQELNCYTEEGVVPQIANAYQLNGLPTIADLIAITRMSFTKWAKSNRAQGYVGSLFMEWLCNIDFSKHPEVTFHSERDAFGVKVGTFETNFGTIEWKLDYAMDENDMAGNAIIIPMEKAVRYVYTEEVKDQNMDDKKIKAKSQYHIVEDCVCLTGLTSLFIGQDVSAAGNHGGSYNTKFVSVPSLTEISAPQTGTVYYLTEEDGNYVIGAYLYDGSTFKPFTAPVAA